MDKNRVAMDGIVKGPHYLDANGSEHKNQFLGVPTMQKMARINEGMSNPHPGYSALVRLVLWNVLGLVMRRGSPPPAS